MNWKKLLLNSLGAGLAGTVGQVANTNLQGGHMAWTAGNLVVPVVTTMLPTLFALFQRPPHK